MTASATVWFRLHWPRRVEPEQLVSLARVVASWQLPVRVVAVGEKGRVEHYLGFRDSSRSGVLEQLHLVAPTLGVEPLARVPLPAVDSAAALSVSTARRPLVATGPSIDVTRNLLAALAAASRGEAVVLEWRLLDRLAPRAVASKARLTPESWLKVVASAALGPPPPLDTDARSALKAKRALPGWRAVGSISARAATSQRRETLIRQVIKALRLEVGGGVELSARRIALKPGRIARSLRPRIDLNLVELAALSGWPVGEIGDLPINRVGSKPLAVPAAVPRSGRTVGQATFPGRERAVALGIDDSLRHLHVLGPTGTGKSTLLLNLIAQDMGAGRGLVVIDPKGDLIDDVLARLPKSRVGDVVLLDPTDEEAVVGLNPLVAFGRSTELAADQLLAVFHNLYAASWGPRTQDILHASLLTLTRTRGATLVALPLLLTDPTFRRETVGRLKEPVVLEPFWAGFENWSEAERTAAIAPVLNKVRPFLLRSSLRAVLGQASPRFDVRQVFSERRVLLVNLAKGILGSEAAALLGSLVIAQLWQATLERAAIPPTKRHPVFIFIDEFQDYLHLPTDLADALAASRGLGVGLTLAHQHMHQLTPEMRSAVLANARSRVCFQLAPEDARLIAATASELEAEDFRELPAFEAYAQLVAAAASRTWFSVRTDPPPAHCSDPSTTARASRERWARTRAEVDAEIQQLVRPDRATGDIGSRPRSSGARS